MEKLRLWLDLVSGVNAIISLGWTG